MYKLPIGVDNFQELVKRDYLFCDKTAMIAELLSKGDKVTLITRPRRWGKTLNISMLQHFFSSEVNGVPTADLFDNLAIGKIADGKYLEQHQGKYPVIMLSFKDINADSFQGAYNAVYELILKVYSSYTYLLSSDTINEVQLRKLQKILSNQANQQQLEASLELLSQCLYQYHGQSIYMLIDEYDTPLNKAYGNKAYLKAMVEFMRNLFSAALKGNNALERGVLTGILRISKDSMLSGLNNLETYTLLDTEYSSHFGFSEEEVQDLFRKNDFSIDFEQVKTWYNGYKVGNIVLYNPWSILSCMNRSGRFDLYWINTGNNDLIKTALFRSGTGIKRKFEQLMQGETICVAINKHLPFDLLEENEASFWTLLLFAGYLKAGKSSLKDASILYNCEVSIPNNEVFRLYSSLFAEWLSSQFSEETAYESFLDHLVCGNVPLFVQELGCFLLQSASSLDTQWPRKSEGFYHGFVLAMLASLGSTHYIKSNRESGLGRYDLLLIPKKEDSKAILLEFKQVRKEEELEHAAKLALQQIQDQAYHTELVHYPYLKEVIEVGIAFSGKSVVAAYATYDLVHKASGVVNVTNQYGQEAFN